MSFNESDTSYRVPYDPPPAASRMAGVRFGNTQDVVVLWNGDSDEISEYIRGLIFIATVTFVIFMTWGLLICVFMCLGKDRVGHWSGRPFVRDAPLRPIERDGKPVDDELVLKQQKSDLYKRGDSWGSAATLSRVVFLFSGLIVILFSILLVTRGLTQLQTSVDTVYKSSLVVQDITGEGIDIIDKGLRDLRSRASSVRTTLLDELNRDIFCPGDPSMENSEVGLEVRKQVDAAVVLLEELEGFQDKELSDFRESLLDVEKAAKSVQDTAKGTDFLGWKSMILLIPYTAITALLMSATVMAFFDVSFTGIRCMIDWVLLPIFILMTAGACVLASFSALVAGVNSDFCLPGGDESASPDENIVGIMVAEGYQPEDFEFRMVRYFVEQCTSEDNPFAKLTEYLPDMRDNQLALNEVVSVLRDGDKITELSLYCNREFHALDSQVDNMRIILDVLISSMERLLDLISCRRIVPIYTDTIYNASCEYSTKAIFWVFCCSIILGTFGLVMISLRASYKLTIENGSRPLANQTYAGKEKQEGNSERDPVGQGSPEHPVHATPYGTVNPPPEEAPPGEIRVDNTMDDEVFTTFTGHVSNESVPFKREYTRRGTRYQDDDTITREKKATAIDVD